MSKLGRQLIRSIKQAANTVYRQDTGKRDWKYEWFELKYAALNTLVYSWLTPITVWYESVVRILKWIPILWEDRHWDWNRILVILEHKIRFTRECIGKYDRHVSAQQDCIDMKRAEFVLRRLQDPNQYIEQDWAEHWARWPSRGIFSDLPFSPPTKEESKDVRRMMEKENYMWRQDMDWLCRHFKKHMQGWWD